MPTYRFSAKEMENLNAYLFSLPEQ